MSDLAIDASPAVPTRIQGSADAQRRTAARNAAEWRFRAYGLLAIFIGLACVAILFGTIIGKGWTAFAQTAIALDVKLDPAVIDPSGGKSAEDIDAADYQSLAAEALYQKLGLAADDQEAKDSAAALLSTSASDVLKALVKADLGNIGATVPVLILAHGNIDALMKGEIDRNVPEAERLVGDRQLAFFDKLLATGAIALHFNKGLFTFGASSQPETAGLAVAIVGSLFMMLTVVALAVPLGVAAAIYLEEYAPRNWFTTLVEVNINNLAAVPSIVFGLLGLSIFINFAGLPRSASIVGGLVLTLMTLPTIIITARSAITAVPPSIREAALGVGASKMQSIFHHVLPLAFPGILTGTIIGLAKALGETAPLLMIGMVAFVVDVPKTPLDPATALPVQIFMWAGAQERGFVERTSGATMALLLFLMVINIIAVVLRRRFERKW